MIYIADVCAAAPSVDHWINSNFSIRISQDIPICVLSWPPDNIPNYTAIHFKFCRCNCIIMIFIVSWIYSSQIFEVIWNDRVFLEKACVRLSRIYISVGIIPSLYETGSSCHRICPSRIWILWTWHLIT